MRMHSSSTCLHLVVAFVAVQQFSQFGRADGFHETAKSMVKKRITCIASDDRTPYLACCRSLASPLHDVINSDLLVLHCDTLSVTSTYESVDCGMGYAVLSDSCKQVIAIGTKGESTVGFPEFNLIGSFSFDPATGKLAKENIRKANANSLGVAPAGGDKFHALAINGNSTMIDVLDIRNGEVLRQFDTGRDNYFGLVRLTPSGILLHGEHNWTQDFYKFSMWDLHGRMLAALDRGEGTEVSDADWSEKAKLLAIADESGGAELFHLVDEKVVPIGGQPLPRMPNSAQVDFSPDGTKLVVSTFTELSIWDLSKSKEIKRFKGEWLCHFLGDRRFVLSDRKGGSTELSVWKFE